MHVLIAGAGLGGLTLAQALRKQGISYEIFERDANRDARFQGWAIALHTIIDQFLSVLPSDMPDLRESTDHLAPLKLRHQFVYYHGGREDRLGFEDSPATPFIRAERARLRDWLLTNIPVQWNKTVTLVENNDDGVVVHFRDGTSAKGDMLVGADGAHSVVREHVLQQSSSELLRVVPLSAIVGELSLSGEAMKRQLELGHSAYNLIDPELGFIGFVGLHRVSPDGQTGHFYWMFMQPEPEPESADQKGDTSRPEHWLQTATQRDKLDHVLKTVAGLPPKLREIFELTPVEGIRKEAHVWRDMELASGSLPPGRVALLGDAAHTMTPSRGEGAFHAFLDAIKLAATLGELRADGRFHDINLVKAAVAGYHDEMLKRGSAAVRASRNAYHEAKKRVQTGLNFLDGLRPLPVESVVLEVQS